MTLPCSKSPRLLQAQPDEVCPHIPAKPDQALTPFIRALAQIPIPKSLKTFWTIAMVKPCNPESSNRTPQLTTPEPLSRKGAAARVAVGSALAVRGAAGRSGACCHSCPGRETTTAPCTPDPCEPALSAED